MSNFIGHEVDNKYNVQNTIKKSKTAVEADVAV